MLIYYTIIGSMKRNLDIYCRRIQRLICLCWPPVCSISLYYYCAVIDVLQVTWGTACFQNLPKCSPFHKSATNRTMLSSLWQVAFISRHRRTSIYTTGPREMRKKTFSGNLLQCFIILTVQNPLLTSTFNRPAKKSVPTFLISPHLALEGSPRSLQSLLFPTLNKLSSLSLSP